VTADEKYAKAYETDKEGVKRFATASDHANWLVERIAEKLSDPEETY